MTHLRLEDPVFRTPEERFTEIFAGSASVTAQEIRDRIADNLAAFSGGCEPHDDQTIVVIRTS